MTDRQVTSNEKKKNQVHREMVSNITDEGWLGLKARQVL
jgi:hypothetical protein